LAVANVSAVARIVAVVVQHVDVDV
jgi:hypothetical protein